MTGPATGSGAAAHDRDPGRAVERTRLAWQRTALAAAASVALTAHLLGPSPALVVAVVLLGPHAVAHAVRSRQLRRDPSRPVGATVPGALVAGVVATAVAMLVALVALLPS